ncbi:L-2-amino-thiazoline-4-carboxylic acid hydrolase [Anabaenopsis elenkinii CCIBt3563]|uniref:L-2-amino-thiazoline-4-carboxylic acid hydrolase n=2 Tax=Anabaenopsis TaxID=110103 RepID=A0A7S6RGX4_9CYAN|nr:L-2-amino-thiazoline-4-carboxylic acid hydrolase [Anabaenopsis elenkinii CCIBt3563]
MQSEMTMEKELVTGNLRMEDIINIDESKAMNLFRKRLQRYKSLVAEKGDAVAFEEMMAKYPEQQKALMGTFIEHNTLAQGFTQAAPLLRLMGFVMDVVDISQNGTDAALEIQRVCPFLSLAQEYGFESPCRVFCEMEQEATRRAFPEIKAAILSKQAEGDCVCVFKYERSTNNLPLMNTEGKNTIRRVISLILLIPSLCAIAYKMLKMRLFK